MHLAIGVDNIDYDLVAQRWTNPLWRLRLVPPRVRADPRDERPALYLVDDYVHRPGWAVAVKSVLFIVLVPFLGMGAYIIFTFPLTAAGAALP